MYILGAEGRRGPKGEPGKSGEKGDPGSFDFLMLMVSDLRHDLEELKSSVNNGGPSTVTKSTESNPSVSQFSEFSRKNEMNNETDIICPI